MSTYKSERLREYLDDRLSGRHDRDGRISVGELAEELAKHTGVLKATLLQHIELYRNGRMICAVSSTPYESTVATSAHELPFVLAAVARRSGTEPSSDLLGEIGDCFDDLCEGRYAFRYPPEPKTSNYERTRALQNVDGDGI